jgi:hypothetical protein
MAEPCDHISRAGYVGYSDIALLIVPECRLTALGTQGLSTRVKSGVRRKYPRGALRFQADAIVHRASETLLASQVPFRRLYRDVTQEELNLLKLSTGGVA